MRNLFTFIYTFICIQHNTNNASFQFAVNNWTNHWSLFSSLVTILHWSTLDLYIIMNEIEDPQNTPPILL